LLRGFVHADHGTIWIVRPVVDFQYVFHGRHEGGIGLRRNDELLFQMRFESIFLALISLFIDSV
jgi:hypothetical protein